MCEKDIYKIFERKMKITYNNLYIKPIIIEYITFHTFIRSVLLLLILLDNTIKVGNLPN